MMQYRKQILAAIFGLMLLFYGGDWLLKTVLRGPLQKRRSQTARLEKTIELREQQLANVRKAKQILAVWQSQSLPGNVEVARSLYRGWLLELVRHVDLAGHSVESGEPLRRKDRYWLLPFTVRGRGSLEQLTKFLFEFYRAPHLHQIGSIGITPSQNGEQLDLSFSIEALALPGADRTDRLASGSSNRLASASLEDYHVILQRNLFAVGGSLDAVEHTYLDGVVSAAGGRPQAWFGLRLSGEQRKLHEGEQLTVGGFTATIVEIAVEDHDVVLEADGQRWLLSLGENLTEAFALPPEF
ncbi:MAG: hypothetical protein JXB62_23345 [Pirellulales bacterium]|nr:hypothetical protein [Pirellulales bacterium]